jgi:hypothetical protein
LKDFSFGGDVGVEDRIKQQGAKHMTIADLPSIMGAVLVVSGLFMVLVQFFFRPPTENQTIYGALVTTIIVGALRSCRG